MDDLQDFHAPRPTFLSHVFPGTDESNSEMMNAIQYAMMGIVPVFLLNKLVQTYVPDVDEDKATIEILFEMAVQVAVMFGGIIFIHRAISYFPTYSGDSYGDFNLTSVILAILIIMMSVQTKLGLKANIVYQRAMDAWEGKSKTEGMSKRRVVVEEEEEEEEIVTGPPAPISTSVRPQEPSRESMAPPPRPEVMAANSVVGGAFGSVF
jgi:hypothetical protein